MAWLFLDNVMWALLSFCLGAALTWTRLVRRVTIRETPAVRTEPLSVVE